MHTIFSASYRFGLVLMLMFSFAAIPLAQAHHGWRWATDDSHELSGTIVAVRLGNPHGEVTLEVEGEEWIVEVGQPWRNERVGLSDDMLAPGAAITAFGPRSAREGERLLKAERITIDGKHYNLYPERLR